MGSTSKYKPRYDSHGIALRKGERQRPTGTYEFKFKDSAGFWQRISAPTLSKLREKEETVDLYKAEGIRHTGRTVTLNTCYETWKRAKRGLRANVRSHYIDMYDRYVKKTLGRTPINTLTTSKIQTFYAGLVNSGLAITTVNNVHTVIHQVLQLAYRDNLLRRNPADEAMAELKNELTQKPGRKRVALTPEQQLRLKDFLLTYDHGVYRKWYAVFVFIMATGLRLGEFAALQWSDIDWDAGTVSVSKTLVYYPDAVTGKMVLAMHEVTKTADGKRVIPLSTDARGALQMQYDLFMECKTPVDGYNNFCFLNRFSQPWTQGNLNKALRERIIPQCNMDSEKRKIDVVLPAFSTHSLRHTFCSNLCRANVNIKRIQKLMGHKDIRTTLDIYAEVTGQDLQDGVDQMDDYVETYLETH